jgi:hypothetical protein
VGDSIATQVDVIMLAFFDTKTFGATFVAAITLAISYQAGMDGRDLLALPLLVVIAYCLVIYRQSR